MKSPKRFPDPALSTARSLIQKLANNGTTLVGAIDEVLTFLEDRRTRDERLPRDCVELATTLIRMYSEPEIVDMPAWIQRERARRLADAMARHRILGSSFGPSKQSKQLPPEPPEPVGMAVSLFDLVKNLQQVLEIATKHSSR